MSRVCTSEMLVTVNVMRAFVLDARFGVASNLIVSMSREASWWMSEKKAFGGWTGGRWVVTMLRGVVTLDNFIDPTMWLNRVSMMSLKYKRSFRLAVGIAMTMAKIDNVGSCLVHYLSNWSAWQRFNQIGLMACDVATVMVMAWLDFSGVVCDSRFNLAVFWAIY